MKNKILQLAMVGILGILSAFTIAEIKVNASDPPLCEGLGCTKPSDCGRSCFCNNPSNTNGVCYAN